MIKDLPNRAEVEAPTNRIGRPRSPAPMVPTSVRLPQDLFDLACRMSQRERRPLPDVIRQALRDHLRRRQFS